MTQIPNVYGMFYLLVGVAQQEKEVDSFHMGPPGNRHSMPPLGGSSTPPGNRKGVKAFNVSAQHASMKGKTTSDNCLQVEKYLGHSLSQQGVWVSFGHPNPQNHSSGY